MVDPTILTSTGGGVKSFWGEGGVEGGALSPGGLLGGVPPFGSSGLNNLSILISSAIYAIILRMNEDPDPGATIIGWLFLFAVALVLLAVVPFLASLALVALCVGAAIYLLN